MKLDGKPTQEEPMIKILYRKPVMSRARGKLREIFEIGHAPSCEDQVNSLPIRAKSLDVSDI